MWLDALKKMKTNSKLTTAEIAKGSGIPEATLEKLFAGATKDPKLCTMQRLVYFLGYKLEDLYKDESEPPADLSESKIDVETVINTFVGAGLIPKGEDLSDKDLRFLMALSDAIDSWFTK